MHEDTLKNWKFLSQIRDKIRRSDHSIEYRCIRSSYVDVYYAGHIQKEKNRNLYTHFFLLNIPSFFPDTKLKNFYINMTKLYMC